MKVSVIIAAYNAEKYLHETLNSVLKQTMNDYEVIVVNDGSKDHTLSILKDYQKEYKNLIVLEKENGGPSSARNYGLNFAKGEYIFFFDADDILEADALEALYEKAITSNADLVIAKYDIFSDTRRNEIHIIDELVKKNDIEKYDSDILWTFTLWNKIFKREIIEKANLRFPSIGYTEDGVFVMSYVFQCKKIVGLDQIVCHYRKLFEGDTSAITATVSYKKVSDYICAHEMIYDVAQKTMMKDYPEYTSIENLLDDNDELKLYLNVIIWKELQTLIDQFYLKFWNISEEMIGLIVDEWNKKYHLLNSKFKNKMINRFFGLSLNNLPKTYEMMKRQSIVTVALYGDVEHVEETIKCMESLEGQKVLNIKIILPKKIKQYVEKKKIVNENVIYEEGNSKRDFYESVFKNVTTQYILFTDYQYFYVEHALRISINALSESYYDFIVDVVRHRDFGTQTPIYINHEVWKSYYGVQGNQSLRCFDNILANKYFKVSFLKSMNTVNFVSLEDFIEAIYKKGIHKFNNRGTVIFSKSEYDFNEEIIPKEKKEFLERYLMEGPDDLTSEEYMVHDIDFNRYGTVMQSESKKSKLLKKAVGFFSKLSCKDRALFITTQTNEELAGNAKALFPYIKGKKKVIGVSGNQSYVAELKTYYYLLTSKVIIIDDVVQPLKYIRLKPEQKVIQLWHECGALKKLFGSKGINPQVSVDTGNHMQYSMVTVSSNYVRTVYSEEFGINIKKIKALGCPKTDEFFKHDLIENKKQNIYKKYPELEGKQVIIYTPSLRDNNGDGSIFKPKLDFDCLSQELLKNQVFIVCPHPIMKNEIVSKEYQNIKVIRDFSITDMMFVSDMMITDYSSVMFEYMLLNKPIAFYCYDLASYNSEFYVHYPCDLPGNVFQSQSKLISFLRNTDMHTVSETQKLFLEKYMDACDGQSCERIAKIINKYMGEK